MGLYITKTRLRKLRELIDQARDYASDLDFCENSESEIAEERREFASDVEAQLQDIMDEIDEKIGD